MISDRKLAEIIVLRGLGYTQNEIAHTLSLSKYKIWYHLNETNKQARKQGNTPTFLGILTQGYLPEILDKIKRLEKIT
ncbi:MAG: hypothetical protein GF334_00270 [Candidatus Altiarchaeales archaeon]|nr:hypothetical protein [Candidatus Altiarchaeales archaeon]